MMTALLTSPPPPYHLPKWIPAPLLLWKHLPPKLTPHRADGLPKCPY